MIKNTVSESNQPSFLRVGNSEQMADDFYQRKLREGLGSMVAALDDIDIQRRVEEHFRDNPSLSREPSQVVAVACQLKRVKVFESRLAESKSSAHEPGSKSSAFSSV